MEMRPYVILDTNTLLKKFPVIHPTPVDTDMEKKIQNRLLCGFENWNRGFDAWKAWGDVLYTQGSIYNVHAVKLSLQGYQMAMNLTMKRNNILMGDFYNMVICDDWCGIHYAIATENKETGVMVPGSVMEFVHFTDLGGDRGAVVDEGWAGTRGPDFEGLSRMQGPEHRGKQEEVNRAVLNAVIPETDDLTVKFTVTHPTAIKDTLGMKIRDAILKDFDKWNQGAEIWCAWADEYFTPDYKYTFNEDVCTLEERKAKVADYMAEKKDVRISFDSLLISGDWAAIHYRMRITDEATGETIAADRMEFLHFVEDGDSVCVDASWMK